ncbi:MAG: GDSL-type esterase/lipase family protein, partial [Actinomycetota bacterium]
MSSVVAVVATIAAGLAVGVAPLTGAAHAGAATKPTLRMAVLGDSYSAGVGVGLVGTGCDRDRLAWGPRAYNELLGSRYTLGSLKFVACSGYTSDQITANQLGAVTSSTNMVTLTAGGNDIGFGAKVFACVLHNCPSSLLSLSASSAERPRQTWIGLRAKLADLYVRIRQRMAPGGKLFVATYPIPFAEVDHGCAGFL